MTARARSGGTGVALACMVAAAALLVVSVRFPMKAACDSVLGIAAAAFASAQALCLVALAIMRRGGQSSLVTTFLALSWAVLSGAALAIHQAAGDADAVRRSDVLIAVGTALCLLLLFNGLAMKLETATRTGWWTAVAVALVLSFASAALSLSRVSLRPLDSWNALDRVAAALKKYQAATGAYPVSARKGDVFAQLEPTYAQDLPRTDGWRHEIDYVSDGKTFELASRGAFGARGEGKAGPVGELDADIVMRDYVYVSWPLSCDGAPVDASPGPTGAGAQEPEGVRSVPAPEGAKDSRPPALRP